MTAETDRRATPRPHPTAPTLIRRTDVDHHVWGDAEGGYVTDRVICSTDQLHVLEFELPPGASFRHTAANPTVFAADVAYLCQEGTLALADPTTGELVLTPAGHGVHFGRDTWHHGFAVGERTVRVIEFMAPPPSRGTASTYGRTRPLLQPDQVRHHDDRWRGRWPHARAERDAVRRLTPLGGGSELLSMRDDSPAHLIATLLDTPFLTVHRGTVQPAVVDTFRPLDAETLITVESGELWVDIRFAAPGAGADPEFWVRCLLPGDSCFAPAGCELRMLVRAAAPAVYLQGSGRVPAAWRP